MATNKRINSQIMVIIAFFVIAAVVLMTPGTTAQTGAFSIPAVQDVIKYRTITPVYSPALGVSTTVGLRVNESTIFSGHTVKLLNVASNPSPAPVIVDVDGITKQTVSGKEAIKDANGNILVTIKVEGTLWWNDIKWRYAILTIS